MFSINGRFVTRRFGGQERYSYEIITELDKFVGDGEFELVVPAYADRLPELKNIKIVKYGNIKGHLWEQTNYFWYLKKNKRIGVNTCITCPILKPDIVTMHDISQLVHPEWYSNTYGKISKLWHEMMFKSAARNSILIFTVSEFSKKEIVNYFKIEENRIVVTGNGWQHFSKIEDDKDCFDKYSFLKKGEYFLSASSITPQKKFPVGSGSRFK